MHTGTLERVLEHPKEFLKVAARTRRSALVLESFLESFKILALQLDGFLEAIVVLETRTTTKVVI